MRTALVFVLALVACKREHAGPAQATGSAQGSAQPHDAAVASIDAAAPSAPAGPVNLLAVIPVTMAVSSVVANPKISAYDLVDGSMDTAWNSKTGELVGAWIAFRMPPSTHVDHVELTAGFVSKGPEGDYFTLNPRIKKVAVWHDGVRLREVELDSNSRELQKVPVDANGGDYKIEVTAIEPGAKKTWRETCVSELRVMGTPAPGTKLGDYSPTIAVGSLDADPLRDPNLELTVPASYASVAEYCEAFKKQPAAECQFWLDCNKHPDPTTCGDAPDHPLALPALPAGWTAHWFTSHLANAEVSLCNLAIEAQGRTYVLDPVGDAGDCGKPELSFRTRDPGRTTVSVADIVGSPDPELFLVTTVPTQRSRNASMPESYEGYDMIERLQICAKTANDAPACQSSPIAQTTHKVEVGGEPGADGMDAWDEYVWTEDYKIDHGVLIVGRATGKPDDPQALSPGRYRFVLPH